MEPSVQGASAEWLLATLVQLSRRARQADSAAELRFLLVNESQALVPYRQAVFWSVQDGVQALSGVVEPDRQAPYVQWLSRWFMALPQGPREAAFSVDLNALSDDREWQAWLPAHLLMVPLPGPGTFAGGYLLLARDEPFVQAERDILQEWGEVWSSRYALECQQSWRLTAYTRWRPWLMQRRRRWVAALITLAILLLPLRLSVLAPAELVALEPAVIRAPMDGIIDRILVTPNQRVEAGETLLEFDRVSLASRLQVAERELATLQARYRQSAQRALYDAQSKSELAVLQSRIDEQGVSVAYLQALNQRSVVQAPQAGVVLLNDATQWIGQPVVTGERVMMIADETRVQLEAWLSPADMIALQPGDPLVFFLSASPLQPLEAHLAFVAHTAELRPEGHYAYRVRAFLAEGQHPRIGLKGTAKLYGERVPLIYWLTRRPWAALRAWVGW